MIHKNILLCLVFSCLRFTSLTAQESINCSGGDASSNIGSISYSIGEVFYTSISGNNITLTQGVQQSYKISTLTTPEVNNKSSVFIKIYPNPTTTNLTISITDITNQSMSYQLFNLQGKIIKKGTITSLLTNLSTVNLASGTYIINIKDAQYNTYSYKVIKE